MLAQLQILLSFEEDSLGTMKLASAIAMAERGLIELPACRP